MVSHDAEIARRFHCLLAIAGPLLAQPRDVKFALPPLPPNSPAAQGAPILAQRLSRGDLQIVVLPPSSVGNASAVLQGARVGGFEMALVRTLLSAAFGASSTR
jgi:hypothetical protein